QRPLQGHLNGRSLGSRKLVVAYNDPFVGWPVQELILRLRKSRLDSIVFYSPHLRNVLPRNTNQLVDLNSKLNGVPFAQSDRSQLNFSEDLGSKHCRVFHPLSY